jgi:hypothetical protein
MNTLVVYFLMGFVVVLSTFLGFFVSYKINKSKKFDWKGFLWISLYSLIIYSMFFWVGYF